MSEVWTYEYKAKGGFLFLAHLTEESIAGKKERNEEYTQYFEIMFEYSDGFLKSKDAP